MATRTLQQIAKSILKDFKEELRFIKHHIEGKSPADIETFDKGEEVLKAIAENERMYSQDYARRRLAGMATLINLHSANLPVEERPAAGRLIAQISVLLTPPALVDPNPGDETLPNQGASKWQR